MSVLVSENDCIVIKHFESAYMFVNSKAETSVRGREGTAKTDVVARKTGSDPWPLLEST